ncbi:MAG: choice-of-anchor B family protein [Bacteroidetes bacterium]|nr:MAG: choice-of-anchor B family protein [Bacteroidota bacterium]
MKRIVQLPFIVLFLLFSSVTQANKPDANFNSEEIGRLRAAYGAAVAFAGEDIIISENSGFTMPGMVHVIRKSADGSWNEVQTLQVDNALPGDGFGSAVAADGNTLFIARYSESASEGEVFVFERRDNGEWVQTQKIELNGSAPGDKFGMAMIVSGRHAVISAPGQNGGMGGVHTFMYDGNDWSLLDSIAPGVLTENAGFGTALSWSDGLLVIGAPENREGKGNVFIFRTANGGHSWIQTGDPIAPATEDSREFGSVLLTDGQQIFVGQPLADQLNGQVQVFEADNGSWSEISRLGIPPIEGVQHKFGTSLVMDDSHLWISVPGAYEESGGVFVYASSDGGYKHVETIEYAEAQQPRGRASVLAVNGSVAIIGVRNRDYGEGIVHIIERDGALWKHTREIYRDLGSYTRVVGGQVDCEDGTASEWSCEGIDLIAFIPNTELGSARGSRFNDVWGWTDPETGKEYGILGHMEGAIFVDLSDPFNPIVLGELPRTKGSPGSTHRDIKTYKNHAFIVADGAQEHGMQVFDLTLLRNVSNPPVVFEPTAMYTEIASSHNIVINEETGFAYAVGSRSGGTTCGGALHMIDIRDPLNPKFAGCFRDTNTGTGGSGATHDAQCIIYNGPDREHAGKEICVGYNGTAVSIADVSDKNNPIPISVGTYPNSAYVHQGWFTDDHRFFYQNDEADELSGAVSKTRTLIWDVSDLDDPIMIAEFFGQENSTDHNLYIKGDLMYQTNNASGLRIIDIKDRSAPIEVGFFDTTPMNLNVAGFDGTWSSYPYFESGMILITSRREGMFVVKKREIDT